MSGIDWAGVIRAGHRLGLLPPALWRLSVREWRALLAPDPGPALNRAGLDRLCRQHPDTEEQDHA